MPADCSTFLEARKRELAELEEQTAAARRQEEAVEQERTAQQENVREAVEAVDAAQAATQKRLETTEAFRVQLERTKVGDAVTKHAEERRLWRKTTERRRDSLTRRILSFQRALGRYHFTVTDSILRDALRPLRDPDASKRVWHHADLWPSECNRSQHMAGFGVSEPTSCSSQGNLLTYRA